MVSSFLNVDDLSDLEFLKFFPMISRGFLVLVPASKALVDLGWFWWTTFSHVSMVPEVPEQHFRRWWGPNTARIGPQHFQKLLELAFVVEAASGFVLAFWGRFGYVFCDSWSRIDVRTGSFNFRGKAGA